MSASYRAVFVLSLAKVSTMHRGFYAKRVETGCVHLRDVAKSGGYGGISEPHNNCCINQSNDLAASLPRGVPTGDPTTVLPGSSGAAHLYLIFNFTFLSSFEVLASDNSVLKAFAMPFSVLPLSLIALTLLPLAFSLPKDTSQSASKTQQSNTVSWQSAFLGLVPLVLNAMTQPSAIDFGFPESSLLFAARSSPFICIADSLAVLLDLSIQLFFGTRVRDAAGRALWRRAWERLGGRIETIESSAANENPKTFLIMFIVTLLQAIKIIGLGGMFWTKFWAGVYLCSYSLIALVQLLAPEDWQVQPTEKRDAGVVELLAYVGLYSLALVAHVCACLWALYKVAHFDDQRLHAMAGPSGEVVVSTAHFLIAFLGSGFFLPPLLVAMALLFFGLSRIYLRVKHYQHVRTLLAYMRNHRFSPTIWELLSCLLGFILISGYMLLIGGQVDSFSDAPRLRDTIAGIAIQGGAASVVGFGALFLLLKALSTVANVFDALRWLRLHAGIPTVVVVFPFFNFLVAFLYYRFEYDPAGTFKPAWAENLG